ncbi:type IV pilin protein [Candidatus Avelusimicrobium alvi]|uniref:type IV pilin protein n=1 Tax=Candidatus Avelusimicrobium alvi TaxID=3416221 RepID=UPI003D1152F9
MKKGFTLIELLVVVLIIGILSSVALPQYQKSVDKSRAAAIWPALKSYHDAMEVCRLGKGSDCLRDELDIELPSTSCKFSFYRNDSCSFQGGSHYEDLPSGGGMVVWWGVPPSGFGLGMGPGGKRFCISASGADGSDCKTIGFSQSLGYGVYHSWGNEYGE